MAQAQTIETPAQGGAPLAADSVERLFELIGESDLIANGQAMLVSIAPVKAALGERWNGRREQIHGLTERYLEKHLSPTDLCHKVGETHYLVATPDKPTIAAQALCYRALNEILGYFLGEARPSDLDVSMVAELSAEGVKVRPVSASELRQADEEADAATAAADPPPAPALSRLDSLVAWPLVTADGQELRISFAIDPVMDLKAWAMAGHRIEARIVNLRTGRELNGIQRRSLLPRDFERIDMAALERGLSRLSDAESFDRPKLIIQLSFASLSNGHARAALLDQARELQHVLRHGAICELVDVEPGVPVGRLEELASLVRTFFRSVWVQVEPTRATVERAIAARVSGLTVRSGDFGADAASIAVGLRKFPPMVKRSGLILTAASLPSTDLLIDAMAAGFTHATLRAVQTDAVQVRPPVYVA